MPTFTHSKSSLFTINDAANTPRDISNTITKITFPRILDKAETSTLGSTFKSYVPGLADATFSLELEFDLTVMGYLDGIVGNVGRAFIYGPIGSTAGNPKYTGTCFLVSLSEMTDISAEVKVSADFQLVGAPTVTTY